MAIEIEAPDGAVVEFPDGTSDDVITSEMNKAYPASKFAKTKGVTATVTPVEQPEEPDPQDRPVSEALGAQRGMVTSFDNAAAGLEGLARKAGLPVDQINEGYNKIFRPEMIGKYDSAEDIKQGHREFLDNQDHKPGMMGQIAGTLVGQAPMLGATGVTNPLLLGAMSGGLASEAKDTKGVAADAAIGGAFGKAGQVATKALGSVVAPQVREAVRRLIAEKIPVTPGQILGGAPAKIEEAVASVPFLGDMVAGAHKRGIEGFSKATVQRALTPLGEKLPDNVPAGHASVDHAQGVLSKAYDDVLDNVHGMLDRHLADDIIGLRKLAKNLPEGEQKVFEGLIHNEVAPVFNAQTGTVSGRAFKDLETILGQRATRFGKSMDPHHQDLADAIRELQGSMRNMLARQNPKYAERLQSINEGYSHLVRAERAAANAGVADRGVATPAIYNQAVKASDNSVRNRTMGAGHARDQDLSADAGEVLSKKLGDSGTATRGMVGAGGAALLFGAVPQTANPLGVAAVGAITAAYTKYGQKGLQVLMTERPQWAPAIRKILNQNAGRIGRGTAALGTADRSRLRTEHRREDEE